MTTTQPTTPSHITAESRHDELLVEQAVTLASPRRRYGIAARPLFRTMDLLYGRQRTLQKFLVLELVARVPYQQDNEQWHLCILEDMLEHRGATLGRFRYRFLPQVIAFVHYRVSWLLFVLRPEWSYRLNADFEDHAEHDYMAFVAEHPELEVEACACSVSDDYHCPESFADVLRQIGVDERHHKDESIEDLARLASERAGRTD